jgi:hypothetical protein
VVRACLAQAVTRLAPEHGAALATTHDVVMAALVEMLPHAPDVSLECLESLLSARDLR